MTGERRQPHQFRGLSATYSQPRRGGAQNSNVFRLAIRNQGATPDIVVTQPSMYTLPSVQERFFDDFTVQESRTSRIPSNGRQQSSQSLLCHGECSASEARRLPRVPLERPSSWLTRGEESPGRVESAASETLRRSSAAYDLDNAVTSRVQERENSGFRGVQERENSGFRGVQERENSGFRGVHQVDNVTSAGAQEFENLAIRRVQRPVNSVSEGAHEFENATSGGAYDFENVTFRGVPELENVVSGGVHQVDNVTFAGAQELENVVSSGLEMKRRRTQWLDDEENEATKEERKVQKRRESNRLSAQRCREKKRLSQRQMEEEMEDLKDENSELQNQLRALQGENVQLEHRIGELEALARSMLSAFDRQSMNPNRGSTPDFNYSMERRYF